MSKPPLCYNDISRHLEVLMFCHGGVQRSPIRFTLHLNWSCHVLLSLTIYFFHSCLSSMWKILVFPPQTQILVLLFPLLSGSKAFHLYHQTCWWVRAVLWEERWGMSCLCCGYVKQDLQQDECRIWYRQLQRLNKDILLQEAVVICCFMLVWHTAKLGGGKSNSQEKKYFSRVGGLMGAQQTGTHLGFWLYLISRDHWEFAVLFSGFSPATVIALILKFGVCCSYNYCQLFFNLNKILQTALRYVTVTQSHQEVWHREKLICSVYATP